VIDLDTRRFLASSRRVDTAGIDYEEAARRGLTRDERFVLTYFADVENQSLRYLRTLLGMKVAFEPEIAAFLATWNYEEFFHGYELEELLRTCGEELGRDRRNQKRQTARLNERLEALFIPLVSRLYADEFPAVYMAFGAVQELTTLRGYEQLARRTENPALRTLAERIAKQERRHFAWYYQSAHKLLARSARARRLTRTILRVNWVPVGAGVHTPEQVGRLFGYLFYPRPDALETVRAIDSKIAALPGLADLTLMERYFRRARLV
jgi:hypothetical protein